MDSDYYLEFENKFRGNREKIFNLFSSYEPLIEIAIKDKSSTVLLDVGCGRGEWLERCQNKFTKSIGIESDAYMAKICRDYGLNIIEADAINELSKFKKESISIITIFHLIEHLEYKRLQKLITECQRILKEDGLLIMETPSIDNLIVSTNSFYIDHTHIHHINAEAISFSLEKVGFSNIKYYYINGGPLQEANPLKVTRILNGIAQDLCIIATKTETTFNKIFSDSKQWESHLNIGLTLFEAATQFDIKLESVINKSQKSQNENKLNSEILLMKQEINLLKNEISLFKSKLRILKYAYKVLKKIKNYIIYLLNFVGKLSSLIFNKIFNLLLNVDFIKDFLVSEKFYLLMQSTLKILGRLSSSKVVLIRNKLKRILDNKGKFVRYNEKLLFHYEQSNKSKEYLRLLTRKN